MAQNSEYFYRHPASPAPYSTRSVFSDHTASAEDYLYSFDPDEDYPFFVEPSSKQETHQGAEVGADSLGDKNVIVLENDEQRLSEVRAGLDELKEEVAA